LFTEKKSAATIINAVDKELKNIIQEDLIILQKIKDFVIETGGKRIRPLLLCFLSEIYESERSGAFTLGAITEIIHAASLLHDDVLDDSMTRRGKPSGKSLFGNKEVILGGDFLLACGIKKLNEFKNHKLMSVFTRVIHDLSVAELLQMEYEAREDIDISIYYKIIYGKTASLFQAAAEAAAIWAKLSNKDFTKLSDLGKNMGLFFQIRDDYLDYYNAKLLKKDPFQDFERGIYTYPVIIAKNIENYGVSIKSFFTKPVKERKKESIQKKFLDILTKSGAKIETEKKLNNLADQILTGIQFLPDKPERSLLESQFRKLLSF